MFRDVQLGRFGGVPLRDFVMPFGGVCVMRRSLVLVGREMFSRLDMVLRSVFEMLRRLFVMCLCFFGHDAFGFV